MDPSSQFCLLLALWSVLNFYKFILPVILGFFLMDCAWSFKFLTQMGDFRCGFIVFGCSSSLGNLILLLFVAIGLGLRVLQFGGLRRLREGFCSKSVRNDGFVWRRKDLGCGDQCVDEDGSLSVSELRKMVEDERRRADEALNDLEMERMAAGSAAEESMAMIMRIQNEKSALQIEVRQLRRLVEDKQAYDREVIQSLEEERSVLEQQLEFCRKRLQMYVEDDEDDELQLDCIAGDSAPGLGSCSRMAGFELDSKWQEQSRLNVSL